MRGSQVVHLPMSVLALLLTMAVGVSSAELGCQCFDFALRASGEFGGAPVSSGNLKLEGAMGLPEFSLVAWADADVLPSTVTTLGGTLKLSQEWLSIGVIAQQNESRVDLSLQGQANPPSWLLFDGMPTIIGGITASVETELLGGTGKSEIRLSPYLTGVIPAGDATVSPSIGIDLGVDSEMQTPHVTGSRFVSTVNAGAVLIANTVHFVGLFEAFSSLVLSMTVLDWGASVSGSLIPTSAGGFSYRLSIGCEWGDSYLLPDQSDKPGPLCTGGVCF